MSQPEEAVRAARPPSAQTGRSDRLKSTWRARLIAIFAVPCILGLTGWQISTSYRDAMENSEALSSALARVAQEHFVGTMRTIDHVLAEVIELAPANGRIPEDAFTGLARSRMRHFPFIRNAFVAGADGIVRMGTMESFRGIDIKDREYFSALEATPSLPLYISAPLESRARPVTSIFIARAILGPRGEFRGVAVIAIDPAIFESELRSILPQHGGFATLLRNDGMILGRVPDGEKWAGKIVAGGPAMTATATSSGGVLRGEGAIDGARRILAYQKLDGYPLVVVVGVRLSGVLSVWRGDAILHLGVGLCLSLLMGAMAMLSDHSNAQRLRAQKALADSEARYRLLNDRSPLGVLQSEADGSTVYANDRWLELVGRERAQVLGAKWCDLVDPDDRPEVLRCWIAMIRSGGVFTAEMRVRTPTGAVRWLRGHATPLDDSPSGAGLVATFEDITNARMVEQSLRLSEEKFAKAFLGSPDALVISTLASGRYLEVNNAFCRFLGYERDELMGCDALSRGVWAKPEDRARLVEIVARDGQVDDFETILRRKDGATMIALVSVQRISVAGESCLLFICRDITERREMETRTRTLLAKLDASNQELEQFAYVTSHDLQEPLRMISGYAQLLERRYRGRLDQDADEFIAFLVDGAKRMQVMIHDLLEYSRVERLGGAFAWFSGADALEDVRRNLLAATSDADGVIEVGPMPDVFADRSQFVRLMQNLIGNALKYHHPDRKPVIKVAAERVGPDLVFSVADNGIGIDPQYFNRIFLVFQRLHTREKYEGTGIGLAICKKIVERHGGRLWLDSQPDQGCVFRFSLPVPLLCH
ncbi:PAS domain-containing sensor histidine kinase [Paramagnetospirillum kuznetsovii]|uniref:histidine kinase n=1 Tax=Paramagnetospirillum kuznetsovii TaxID=2053833 RepID=A0A364NT85_9PROT|nr:PAS domain S-box protein [Paramagnetospirillum kuznetsovii]RAU20125.1 PAS domain-containing sensor histidine kinase [Paramagnetospirillum kuznetsovii]